MRTITFLKPNLMKNQTNRLMLLLFVFNFMALGSMQAQRTEHYGKYHTINLGNYDYKGVVLYDATFEGFATQLKIHNTQLYITYAPDSFIEAAENMGLKKVSIPGTYSTGYPITKFTIYMEGTARMKKGSYGKEFLEPFEVQLSRTLGDFATLEFSSEAKSRFKDDKDAWEKYGDVVERMTEVTEMYLQDFDIRVK